MPTISVWRIARLWPQAVLTMLSQWQPIFVLLRTGCGGEGLPQVAGLKGARDFWRIYWHAYRRLAVDVQTHQIKREIIICHHKYNTVTTKFSPSSSTPKMKREFRRKQLARTRRDDWTNTPTSPRNNTRRELSRSGDIRFSMIYELTNRVYRFRCRSKKGIPPCWNTVSGSAICVVQHTQGKNAHPIYEECTQFVGLHSLLWERIYSLIINISIFISLCSFLILVWGETSDFYYWW